MESEAGMIETDVITCPDCGFEIEFEVKRHDKGILETSYGPVFLRPAIVTRIPGACPRCGACLK